MYIPAHFAVDDAEVEELLAKHGAADLVTLTEDGLLATMLPFAYEPSAAARRPVRPRGPEQRPVAQARLGESLAIVRGPDAYISPSWYAAKAEHGRVVPTWNYLTAHVYGTLVVHDDPAWVEDIVRRLTAKHEAARLASPGQQMPWSVDDAPREVHRGSVAGHRRPGAADHPDRGQGQAEPEPPGRRHRRHRRWPGRPRR